MPKTYNTPKRTFVVKTRLTEEEHSFFMERMKNYEMSQSEFIRQAIDGAVVKPIIRVNPVNDEVLATLGKLVAEYGKIGNNINQIARTLNEWRSPYPQLAAEIQAAGLCFIFAKRMLHFPDSKVFRNFVDAFRPFRVRRQIRTGEMHFFI